MSKYNELVFIVSDLAKTLSDDTIINENHILFLLNKYRTYLLKQKYDKAAPGEIPASNYQTICADLIEVPMMSGTCEDSCLCSLDSSKYLRTKKKLPKLLDIGSVKVTNYNRFKNAVSVISAERMEYVGYSSWLQNIIYGAVAPDYYMYFKSGNTSFLNMKRVYITGLFEDPIEAAEQSTCENESCGCGNDCHCGDVCTCGKEPCEDLEKEFPLEDDLITQLLALVIKDVIGAAWRPMDSKNNAADELADIASFVRQNMKQDHIKKISSEE